MNKINLKDIRKKDWLEKDSTVSTILENLINVENLLISLDEYNTDKNLNYDLIEDFMLQIGNIREKFTNYIDQNIELTNIKIN